VPGEIQSILLTATFDESAVAKTVSINVTVPEGLQFFSAAIASQGAPTVVGAVFPSAAADGVDVVLNAGIVTNGVEDPVNSLNDFIVFEVKFAVSTDADGQLPVEFELFTAGVSSGKVAPFISVPSLGSPLEMLSSARAGAEDAEGEGADGRCWPGGCSVGGATAAGGAAGRAGSGGGGWRGGRKGVGHHPLRIPPASRCVSLAIARRGDTAFALPRMLEEK